MNSLRQATKGLHGASASRLEPAMYRVESYNAADPPSDREHITRGEFRTPEAALDVAKRLVDEQLQRAMDAGRSALEALREWQSFGEIPVIVSRSRTASPVEFDAFSYAEPRARRLAQSMPDWQ
jgi:hypothetical protein